MESMKKNILRDNWPKIAREVDLKHILPSLKLNDPDRQKLDRKYENEGNWITIANYLPDILYRKRDGYELFLTALMSPHFEYEWLVKEIDADWHEKYKQKEQEENNQAEKCKHKQQEENNITNPGFAEKSDKDSATFPSPVVINVQVGDNCQNSPQPTQHDDLKNIPTEHDEELEILRTCPENNDDEVSDSMQVSSYQAENRNESVTTCTGITQKNESLLSLTCLQIDNNPTKVNSFQPITSAQTDHNPANVHRMQPITSAQTDYNSANVNRMPPVTSAQADHISTNVHRMQPITSAQTDHNSANVNQADPSLKFSVNDIEPVEDNHASNLHDDTVLKGSTQNSPPVHMSDVQNGNPCNVNKVTSNTSKERIKRNIVDIDQENVVSQQIQEKDQCSNNETDDIKTDNASTTMPAVEEQYLLSQPLTLNPSHYTSNFTSYSSSMLEDMENASLNGNSSINLEVSDVPVPKESDRRAISNNPQRDMGNASQNGDLSTSFELSHISGETTHSNTQHNSSVTTPNEVKATSSESSQKYKLNDSVSFQDVKISKVESEGKLSEDGVNIDSKLTPPEKEKPKQKKCGKSFLSVFTSCGLSRKKKN